MSYFPISGVNPVSGGWSEMWESGNAVALGLAQDSTYTPVADAAVSTAGLLHGWTYLAGAKGSFVSVGNPGGGQITVNTAAPHGMLAGQIVYLTSSSAAGYQPPNPTIFVIQSVAATSFNVIATFTATATGTWARGCSLVAGAGAAGNYQVFWSLSISTAGLATLRCAPVCNVTPVNKARATAVSPFGNLASFSDSCTITVSAGDTITFTLMEIGVSDDLTVTDCNLRMMRFL